MLQIFKICTVHKMTHLFVVPNNWHLWSSDMSDQFTLMINDFLASLTDRTSIPDHAQLISNMSTNKGGIGLQHPRCTAIPSLILSFKRCIEYTSQGVWIGRTEEPVKLPRNITSMYENWQSSHLGSKFLLARRNSFWDFGRNYRELRELQGIPSKSKGNLR